MISITTCQKSWQGKIIYEDGVTYVKNPSKGLWDDKTTIALDSIFCIGYIHNDHEQILNRPMGFAVDSLGIIYVCDEGDHRIKVYDRHGEYLRSIGREGKGPGELMNPTDVEVDNDLRVYVLNTMNQRVEIFKNDGSYESSIRYEFPASTSFCVGKEGEVYLSPRSAYMYMPKHTVHL